MKRKLGCLALSIALIVLGEIFGISATYSYAKEGMTSAVAIFLMPVLCLIITFFMNGLVAKMEKRMDKKREENEGR